MPSRSPGALTGSLACLHRHRRALFPDTAARRESVRRHQAYDAQAPEFELARELIATRIESGRGTPTVQRFASAVGARAVVRMEPLTAA